MALRAVSAVSGDDQRAEPHQLSRHADGSDLAADHALGGRCSVKLEQLVGARITNALVSEDSEIRPLPILVVTLTDGSRLVLTPWADEEQNAPGALFATAYAGNDGPELLYE